MKKRLLCGFLGVLMLCSFIVLPAGALESDSAEDSVATQDIKAVEFEDFSFDITIPPDGNETIRKELYVYEKGLTEDGTLIMDVTDEAIDGVQWANLWVVSMEPTGATRTYTPSVLIVADGLDVMYYAEATLDYDDGTYGWKYWQGGTSGHVELVYLQKYYSSAGTYTISIDSASANFQSAGWKYYPGSITVDPATITAS